MLTLTERAPEARPSEQGKARRGTAEPPGSCAAPPAVENPIDRKAHALVARLSGGFSPLALGLAWADWAAHLCLSPGRQLELASMAGHEALRLCAEAMPRVDGRPPGELTRADDRRFDDEAWMLWPFRQFAHAHIAAERWWDEASRNVHGARPESQALVDFAGRQVLDLWSPSNFLATNPEAIVRALNTHGKSLRDGMRHWVEDLGIIGGDPGPVPSADFEVGRNVATTPGKVVARTTLAEIIQYAPTTALVHPEPVVIVPAWILKYYILDLRPENSLIRHLADQGFTVFVVSWKNPTEGDRAIGLDDYRTQGVLAAIQAALAVTGAESAHAVGYCLGGTLTAITAAAMARAGDRRLKTVTLLAALTDFHEAGELKLFTNDSQLAFLEDLMAERGYLEGPRMLGSFNLLRANDLIWSRMVREYMMGERRRPTDVAAWALDTTRIPARAHADCLRSLYLNNDFAEGRLEIDGEPATLSGIDVPLFVLGTEWDHIAPWQSVYKIQLSLKADVTFVLASGGHNQGVVAPPGSAGRHYRLGRKRASAPFVDAEAWLDAHRPREGSWWQSWFDWLDVYSSRDRLPPPQLGAPKKGYPPRCDAPGVYVKG